MQPELVTMENVPEVIRHKVYEDFVDELKSLGYEVFSKEVICVQYGIPQTRKRHVVLASKIGKIKLNIDPKICPSTKIELPIPKSKLCILVM